MIIILVLVVTICTSYCNAKKLNFTSHWTSK